VAAGGFIGAGLAKGMGRLTAIENAQAKLTGLGNSSRDVSVIMDNALASVKGTSYGLESAATTAAMAVASGIKPGKELEQVLKTTADTAGIAGASMDEMGAIFGSVAARGKLQGDDLMQLQSRGIPVLQMLAEQTGKTSAEISEMVAAGEVDFAMFERALRENVGGAALEAGNTLQGAFKNMGAAAGRAGATVEGAFVGVMKYGMQEATGALDALDAKLKPLAASTQRFLDGTVVPGLQKAKAAAADFFESADFQNGLAGAKVAIGDLVSAGQQLLPVVGNIASALGQAGMQLGQAAWGAFSTALSAAASAASALAGPLNTVTGFLSDHPAMVTAAVAAWAGFKFIPSVAEKMSGSLQGLNDRVGGMRDQFNMVTPYADKMRDAMASNGVEISKLDAKMMALGDTGTGVAAQMAQSYTRASGPLREMASGHRDLAENAKRAALATGDGWVAADRIMAQAGHNMTATVTNFAGTLKGTGAAALTGFKEAGKGVINALGGPFAVGIAAAGTAIAVQQTAVQGAKAAQEQMAKSVRDGAEAQKDLQAALAGTTGELDEQGLAAATRIAKGELADLIAVGSRPLGLDERINQATTGLDGLLLKIPGLGTETTRANLELTRANKQARESYKALEESASEMGLSIEDVNAIVAQGGGEYQQLIGSLRSMGDEGNIAADKLEQARAVIDESVDAARRLDPAAQEAAQAIDVLADSASSSQDKLAALHTLMQAMGLAPKDAEQAMMDAAAAVDEIVEAAEKAQHPVEQLGDALFGMDGKLDPANESARELHERLTGMVGDLENVAVNGGDVQGAMEEMTPAIAATAQEFGLTEERVRELLAAYGGVPDKLETAIALEGADQVGQDLGKVWEAVEQMKSEGKTTLEIAAVGDDAKAVMDELGIKWQETADGNNMVLTATDDEAIEAIQRVTQMAAELGDSEVSPTVFLDTSQIQVSAEQAQAMLDALNLQEPTPQAQLIIDGLQTNHSIAMGDLAFLGAQSPTPQADLNKALLDAGVKVSNDQLDALGKKKSTATADVNNEPARQGVEETKRFLASIKDRVVNIFTRRHDNGGSSAFADGAVRYAADGLLSKQSAQIAPGGRWITWAEDETQGESFIPHAMSKRKRSTQILAETADIFGLGLVDRGGNVVRRDGSSVAPTSHSFRADGGVIASDVLRFVKGENVDGKQAPYSLERAKYTWAGGLLGNWGDCSGSMSGIAAFIAGWPLAGRKFATGNQGQVLGSMGAKPGLGTGARMAFGWFNGGPYGGHTAGTLFFGNGDRINLEMGGSRGDGQIGGRAAGADHSSFTNRAHLPLDGGLSIGFDEIDSDYDTSMPEVASTSVNGVSLSNGKIVSWGKAQSLFEQARDYSSRGRYWEQDYEKLGNQLAGALSGALSGVPKFDIGGRWPTGTLGRNESTKDEIVLTNQQWREQSKIALALPEAGRAMTTAAFQFSAAVDSAQGQVLGAGRGLGGDFIGSAEIVRDAEQGLLDTRANIALQAENISKAEDEVTEARKALAEAESKGGGLDVAQRRKLEDAEQALAKARKDGKPDKIADAEKRLQRAREDADAALAKSEDKNAAEVRKAQDRLNKAEDKLRDTREAHSEALADLEAAERTAIAARYQAVSDLAVGIGEQLDSSFQTVAGLFDQFGRLGAYVDDMRQSISKLHMQQKTLGLERLKELGDLQVKAQDVDRVRLRGAIGVAQAEYDLEQARKNAKFAGLTSIEAMSGAMDRFYETGIFSIEGLTEAEIENSKEVKAALWGVEVARKQAALDDLEASRAREIATLRVAEATLQQTRAAQLLELQTKHLTQATAQLNGMTKNQATGASAGFRGAGKVGSGLGKVIGGIAGAMAGFAAAGPLGAIPGAILAVKGIGDTAKGAIDVHNNRPEMDKAWKSMGAGSKAAVIGGAALSGVAAGAAGVVGGAEGAAIGAELGDAIMDASVGSVTHSIGSRLEVLERRQADEVDAFNRDFDAREHDLNMQSLDKEIDYIYARDRAESDLEYARMMRESVAAPTEKLEKAYRDAAEAEKQRSEKQHAEQMRSRGESQRIQNEQLSVEKQLPKLLQSILQQLPEQTRSQVSGVGYLART
ncbi:MAG: hypothetical protein DI609_00840, partial [Corynebacterium urealyticum]